MISMTTHHREEKSYSLSSYKLLKNTKQAATIHYLKGPEIGTYVKKQ